MSCIQRKIEAIIGICRNDSISVYSVVDVDIGICRDENIIVFNFDILLLVEQFRQ